MERALSLQIMTDDQPCQDRGTSGHAQKKALEEPVELYLVTSGLWHFHI